MFSILWRSRSGGRPPARSRGRAENIARSGAFAPQRAGTNQPWRSLLASPMNQPIRACARNLIQFTPNKRDIAAAFLARDESQLEFGLPVGQVEIQQDQSRLLRRDEYLNRAARAQAGALLTNHIAPGRRTLVPSRCAASASRMDAVAAATTSAGWPRSQLLTAPIWVD